MLLVQGAHWENHGNRLRNRMLPLAMPSAFMARRNALVCQLMCRSEASTVLIKLKPRPLGLKCKDFDLVALGGTKNLSF